jgi:hypothetical protein
VGLIRSFTRHSTHEEFYEELEEARARHLVLAKYPGVEPGSVLVFMARNYDWMREDEVLYCVRYNRLQAAPQKGTK